MSIKRAAEYQEHLSNGKVKCCLCPHYCMIDEGGFGKCGARENNNGELFAASYGSVTSIALDPIEKKPLYMFYPGRKIVSIGSFGCNFNCPFCQNYNISKEYRGIKAEQMTPALIAEVAKQSVVDGNIGIAYTYNEPLIGYEFVLDCSKAIRKEGLMNVLVTNGYINEEPLQKLLPYIDALNIDIKAITKRTYKEFGGTLDTVKNTIEIASKICHVEVTTLIIPNVNENDIEEIAKWLSEINPEIPYHLSRFFPRYKYSDREPTPLNVMYRAKEEAEKHLKSVFLGNM